MCVFFKNSNWYYSKNEFFFEQIEQNFYKAFEKALAENIFSLRFYFIFEKKDEAIVQNSYHLILIKFHCESIKPLQEELPYSGCSGITQL